MVDNGLRVNLGPLVGIDNDFNQAVRRIDRNNTPVWQQQTAVFQAAAEDINNSTLSSSSFYDPKRYRAIMGKVNESMQSTFKPGLMDQIFPNTLFNPKVDYGLDFLKRPMEAMLGVMNTPDFGKQLVVPMEMQQLPNGSVVPLAPEIGAEALHFMALGNLAPFYTPVNPRFTPQFPAFGVPVNTVANPGMPPSFNMGGSSSVSSNVALAHSTTIPVGASPTLQNGLINQNGQGSLIPITQVNGVPVTPFDDSGPAFNTLSFIPLNNAQSLGMPNTPGTVNVYPLNFDLRKTMGGYNIGAYNEANPIVHSNKHTQVIPPRQ
jgi:hypothetical protein